MPNWIIKSLIGVMIGGILIFRSYQTHEYHTMCILIGMVLMTPLLHYYREQYAVYKEGYTAYKEYYALLKQEIDTLKKERT